MELWIFYFLGGGLTLVLKLLTYLAQAEAYGQTKIQALKAWFLGDPEDKTENAASWVTTFAVFTVIGYLYIEGITWDEVPGISILPRHWSFAMLLGSLFELIAPATAEKIVRIFK